MGSIDFSCFGVSGCASGSLLAAAVMALSSSALGIRTVGSLDIFDIVFHLATIGTAQTDDPSRFTTVYKRHVVQDFGFRFSVFGARAIIRISPYSARSSIHSNAASQSSSPATDSDTPCFFWLATILDRIELNVHALL
jgi:hypothetical protein